MCFDCENPMSEWGKETKQQMYTRQSERALENIKSMPQWMQRNMGIKAPMVKRGSTIELVIRDTWGRVYYTEPFSYGVGSREIESRLDSFRSGVFDALKDMERDIEYQEQLKDIPRYALEAEIDRRNKIK